MIIIIIIQYMSLYSRVFNKSNKHYKDISLWCGKF